MSSVLILAFSDLASDPRVNRQIRFLSESYDVLAAGYAPPEVPGVQFIRMGQSAAVPVRSKNYLVRKAKGALRLARGVVRKIHNRILSWVETSDQRYWRQSYIRSLYEQLAPYRADLLIANDILTLPVACRLAKAWNAKVLYDAHEYAPRELEDVWQWRWFQAPMICHLCQEYIPQVDAMTTVCQGIADAYCELTGVRATLLTNAPEYNDLPVRLHMPGSKVQMVHHGATIPSRKLENMIYLMEHLDKRFELTFVLVGENLAYRRRLEQLAERTGRVRFLPPVGMRELPRFLNQYDIGLFLLEPTNFNYLHALPNKLFEFIQARLAVAVGASPEMATVVKRTQVGVVGEDFQPKTLAGHLNRLTSDDINRFKHNAHAVAREMSAEANRDILLDICRRLCPPSGRASQAA